MTAPASLLAVMAHPDDADLWAGGTLAVHAAAATVTIAVERAEPERMDEAARGAAILGAALVVVERHTAASCAQMLDRVRPEVVVTHHLTTSTPTIAVLPTRSWPGCRTW